jgi:hypothetical protein
MRQPTAQQCAYETDGDRYQNASQIEPGNGLANGTANTGNQQQDQKRSYCHNFLLSLFEFSSGSNPSMFFFCSFTAFDAKENSNRCARIFLLAFEAG